jgi:hypothetical protein
MAMADPTQPETPLQAALRYAELGLRVIPILPATKRPPFDEWQDKATTNTDTIRLWWNGNPRYGVGIATGHYGQRWFFVLDVDTGVDPKTGRVKEGDDSLADLEAEHGDLPDTVESQSGSGGRHLWFWSPVEVRNDQHARVGIDLDIRGEGGQVVAAPTIHPDTGRPYTWIADRAPGDIKIARAPDWLIRVLTDTTNHQPRTERAAYDGPERPGDRFAASTTWPRLLEADGATYLGTRRDRKTGSTYELWARPGVDDHNGATLYYGGTDLLKVFTPNWPGLEEGKTYTRFGYLTATRYAGDYSKAAAELAHQHDEADIDRWIAGLPVNPAPVLQAAPPTAEDPDGRNWHPADLAAVAAAGLTRPEPSILRRSDGKYLLYAGKINTIFGESGGGKTWLAEIAVAQIVADGGHVIVLDYEDDAVTFLVRLQAIGIPPELAAQHVTYYPLGVGPTQADLDHIDQIVAERTTDLIVIDSTGEALAAQGLDQDRDPEVARWMAALPRRWSRLGPCVLLLDHVPKHGDNRQEIGSQRKRAGINGASYELIQVDPFAAGQPGRMVLKVGKDRGGNYPKGTQQASIEITPNDDGTKVEVTVEQGSGKVVPANPARGVRDYEDEVLEYVRQNGPNLTTRAILSGVLGDNNAKSVALKILVSRGDLSMEQVGQAKLYSSTDDIETY